MSRQPRAVPIVLLVLLLDAMSFGIVLPVLPGLVVHLTHVSMAEATRIAGYMLLVFAVTHFLAGPIIGNLGDRFGRRPVLLICVAAFAIDYALMAAAPTIGWLFAGRVVAGIAGATYGPANAVLADVTPGKDRARVFGLMGAAFGGGFILGPALGGLLAGFGTRAPFIAAAALAGFNFLWILVSLPETLRPEDRRQFEWKRANAFGTFAPLLKESKAVPLILASLLWQIAHQVYPSTWAFWAELRFDWSAAQIGWSLAAAGLSMAIAQALITGRVVARFGEERSIVTGMLVGGVSFTLYAFLSEGWIYPIIFFSALQGLVYPSTNALLSRMTDASNQGALQGGMASVASVGAIIGPLAMTQALALGAERGFPGSAFLLAATMVGAGLLVIVFGVIRRKGEAAPQP
ncbi:TCR/Tet family MFS transporter [Sphingomonas sp. RB56-2]|uniref:TCR/Tet family MFS transporter n=1 Tax=Sphingomonas brevis TaxID=2908206 RepID=A0ABT0SBL9_9SPHN|nr:TCR/Tet family MFS transporter [Sphingomonas brevis]MCL6741485.1 TCR/Tet family MFS transporter [Sphingomonas brevis]